MAKTEFSTSHALRVERWSVVMFQYARFKCFFSKFIGKNDGSSKGVTVSTDSNSMVQLKGDFRKKKGDKVTFAMLAPLIGDGITGDDNLEGNEEALRFYDFAVELFKVRHAVRSEGTLSDRRVIFDAKAKAKPALGTWLAHKIDNYTLAALSGIASSDGNLAAVAPSTNRKWVGGQTAAGVLTHTTNNLDSEFGATATDEIFGTKVIEAVKRKAKLVEPIIRPLVIEGKSFYVMLLHPLQVKALKAETAWKDIQSAAGVRGLKNPIFTGMLGEWDGVILHEWEKIEMRLGEGASTVSEYFDSGDDLDSGVQGARALFCGAQAAVHAYGELPYYKAKEFDYGDEWGIAVGAILAVSKPVLNSEDYGVMVVDTQVVPD